MIIFLSKKISPPQGQTILLYSKWQTLQLNTDPIL